MSTQEKRANESHYEKGMNYLKKIHQLNYGGTLTHENHLNQTVFLIKEWGNDPIQGGHTFR